MPARYPKSRSAFTLIEVMIASAIFLMMLTAMYMSLELAMRHYYKVRDAADIQAETLRVMSRVEHSLTSAAISSVTVNPNLLANVKDRYILFVSADPDKTYYEADPTDGKPKWQRIVCFYVEPQANGLFSLIQKEKKIVASTTLPSSLPTRDDMANDATLPRQVLSQNVSDISFVEGTAVSFRVGLLSERNNGLTITTRVTPRQ